MAESSIKPTRRAERPPTIFYCYAQKDRAFVQELVRALEKQGFSQWVDFESVSNNLTVTEANQLAIRTRDWFLLFLSPDSANSDYVLADTFYAVEQRKPILPIIIRDLEFPAQLAALFQNYQILDMREGIEKSIERLQSTLISDPQDYFPAHLVYPTQDDLILFSKPSGLQSDYVKNLPSNAPLILLDEIDEAQEKIGRSNQWLHVRDLENHEGYVAAWYTSLEKPVQPAEANPSDLQEKPRRRGASPARGKTPDYSSITEGRAQGIDVSRFNESVDFLAAAKAGMHFVFIHDMAADEAYREHFEEDWENAKKAGLLRSLYHVYDLVASPEEQARSFREYAGADPGELPPTVDLEFTDDQLDQNLFEKVIYFITAVEKRFGKKPILYARPSLFRKMSSTRGNFQVSQGFPQDFPLWIAYWPNEPASSTPGRVLGGLPWTFWQYTDKGRLPGMKGVFDLNVYNGSPEELRNWAAGVSKQVPDSSERPVDVEGEKITPATRPKIFRKSISVDKELTVGQELMVPVIVQNQGETDWQPNSQFELRVQWMVGGRTQDYQATASLQSAFPAGNEVPLSFTVRAPDEPGDYKTQWSLRPLGWEAVVEEPGGPFITEVVVRAPERSSLPKVVLRSVTLKEEKVFNNRDARFALTLSNPVEGTVWKRREHWQVMAVWTPVDGRQPVIRKLDRSLPRNVETSQDLDLNVVVRAPTPLGEYQVSFEVKPADGSAIFESQAMPLTVLVEQYEYPQGKKQLKDVVECLLIEPPLEWVKARKFQVKVDLANKSSLVLASSHRFHLHLILRRKDYSQEQHAYQSLEIDLPPGDTTRLTFNFQAPRLQGQFEAEWKLNSYTRWKGTVANGQQVTTLVLIPPPRNGKIILPPRGASKIAPPKAPPPYAQYVYQNFLQPIVAQAHQQPDLHRLDIHLTPRLAEKTGAEEGWKYQVVLLQYEEERGQVLPGIYESPFELDETAAPMEELGTQKAGELLFEGLFSTKQIDSTEAGAQVYSTYDGLRRAMAVALQDSKECLRLQVRLNNQTPAVHNYRWEYLWDPKEGPLATSDRFPFARVLHLAPLTGYIPSPISENEPLRLLVGVASPAVLKGRDRPADLAGLGPITQTDVKNLITSLDKVGSRLKYEILRDASLEGLCDRLNRGLGGKPFQALHLLCHGLQGSLANQACLLLHKDRSEEPDLVPDRLFAQRLESFPDLCLVVLSSCWTASSTNHLPLMGMARYLQAKNAIPAVVAMQDLLQMESAQHFTQGFYRKLVDTGEVDRAANAGRKQIYDHIIRDFKHPQEGEVYPNQWGVPVLFQRLLDGKLFSVSAPSKEKFEPGARSMKDLDEHELKSMADGLLRSAASQVSLQLNLALPDLAGEIAELVKSKRAEPAVLSKAERLRIFRKPGEEDQRWWLVWAAALYRKHPARRVVLYARRHALQEIARQLDRQRLTTLQPAHFSALVQQGGKALWYDETQNPAGADESQCIPVSQILEAGPDNHHPWPEDDFSTSDLSSLFLQDDNTRQPVLAGGKPARSSDWRIALRGFDSHKGDSPPQRVRLQGNLTWDIANAAQYDPAAYQQLLYGENPLQAFAALSQPAGGAPASLDAESAAIALAAVFPDTYLPYRESHRQDVYTRLELQDSKPYTADYAGYCQLAHDLLSDGDLGLEDLVDVHFFLQRLAAGRYSSPEELKRRAAGQVRPRNLRTLLRPVEIDSEQVDSDLVIREGVLVQAAAALNAGKHIILIGPPGTGKTTLAEDLCRFAHDWDFNRGYYLVTATADWTTFDTIGGYMPESGDQLIFRPGIFLEAIAGEKWLVIDEINRADIDKAFGELFTVLSGQAVTLPYKDEMGRLVRILPAGQTLSEDTRDYLIPHSWRIIGTMNIYDKASLFSMSYAFMRRFAFIDVPVPESKAYQRLLEYFIERQELKPLVEGSKSTADHDLRKLFLTDGVENALMRYRAVGPAIARDILEYLRSRTERGKNPFHHGHLAEALSLYVLPQLDRLEQDHILAIQKQLRELFADHAGNREAEALFTRIEELFPFVPKDLWTK